LHGSIAYFNIQQLVEEFAYVFNQRVELGTAPNGSGIGIVAAVFSSNVLVGFLGSNSKTQE